MEIDDAVIADEVIALVLWGWGVGTPGMDMVAIPTSPVRRSSEALEGRKSYDLRLISSSSFGPFLFFSVPACVS